MSNLSREIPTDLYRDFTFLGVGGKDLPWVLGVGLLTPPVLLVTGFPLQALIFPLIWFAVVIPFTHWSRVNRRPYWLTHYVRCKVFGKSYSKVINNSWKESVIKK